MRIGIDARLAYRRGVGTYAANLVLALERTDPRNEYLLFNAPPSLREKISHPRFEFVDLPFPNAAYYEQFLLPRAAKWRKLDLLHYVDNSGPVFGRTPFVLTLHDTMHNRPLRAVRARPSLRHRMVHAYKKWAIRRSVPRAAGILTVSSYSRCLISREWGIEEKRIALTPEGVDPLVFKKVRHKSSGFFRVLVHGAADERKNLPNIFRAARLLAGLGREFQLVIMGMDEAELKYTPYLQQVANLGLARYVEWAGKVPAGSLGQLYAEADLFLYPSRLEGFGLPVLEAFACGIPVVTSNTTSLPEVAGGAALKVNPEDPSAIARAVLLMMDDRAMRERFVRRGFHRARTFTWEKTARATVKFYEEVGKRL